MSKYHLEFQNLPGISSNSYQLRQKYDKILADSSFIDNELEPNQADIDLFQNFEEICLPAVGSNFVHFDRWYRFMKSFIATEQVVEQLGLSFWSGSTSQPVPQATHATNSTSSVAKPETRNNFLNHQKTKQNLQKNILSCNFQPSKQKYINVENSQAKENQSKNTHHKRQESIQSMNHQFSNANYWKSDLPDIDLDDRYLVASEPVTPEKPAWLRAEVKVQQVQAESQPTVELAAKPAKIESKVTPKVTKSVETPTKSLNLKFAAHNYWREDLPQLPDL